MPRKKGGYEKLEETLACASTELKFYRNSLEPDRRPEFEKNIRGAFRTMMKEIRGYYGLNRPDSIQYEPRVEAGKQEAISSDDYRKLLGSLGEMQQAYLNIMEELVRMGRDIRSGLSESAAASRRAEESSQRMEKLLRSYAQSGEGYTTSMRESVISGVERLMQGREEKLFRYMARQFSDFEKKILQAIHRDGISEPGHPQDSPPADADSLRPRLVKKARQDNE